jgi:DNA polymerase elongation subunit (family B)
MRGINISPDTLLGKQQVPCVDSLVDKQPFVRDENESIASNGTRYNKHHQGFLPALLTSLYQQRKDDKGQMLDYEKRHNKAMAELMHVKQYSKKVLLNSAYGAMGNPYGRWYDLDLAVAVTQSGQVAIRWIDRKINEYLNGILGTENVDYVIYCDTDSVYINMDPLVKKLKGSSDKTDTEIVDILDMFYEKKLGPAINQGYEELKEYMGHREQLMFMDRETIADRAVWCSKKHYFMRVHDNEGVRYEQPKIKISGMAFIKTDVPLFCRDKIKELLPIVFDGTNEQLVKEIDDFRIEFENRSVEEIARITSVSNIEKYRDIGRRYKKGTPIGSKSAMIYNHFHEKFDLGTKYSVINEGDKIRYIFLKKQNPLGEETMGFVDFLPPEFEVHQFVDWDLMWEKSFMGPLEEILSAMNWKRKIISTLSSFFS